MQGIHSVVAVALLCLHCGGPEPAKVPEPSPAPEEVEAPAPDAPDPLPEPEPAPEPDPEPEAAPEPKPVEKPKKVVCAELKQGRCKVTEGCAWNTVGKCIDFKEE